MPRSGVALGSTPEHSGRGGRGLRRLGDQLNLWDPVPLWRCISFSLLLKVQEISVAGSWRQTNCECPFLKGQPSVTSGSSYREFNLNRSVFLEDHFSLEELHLGVVLWHRECQTPSSELSLGLLP